MSQLQTTTWIVGYAYGLLVLDISWFLCNILFYPIFRMNVNNMSLKWVVVIFQKGPFKAFHQLASKKLLCQFMDGPFGKLFFKIKKTKHEFGYIIYLWEFMVINMNEWKLYSKWHFTVVYFFKVEIVLYLKNQDRCCTMARCSWWNFLYKGSMDEGSKKLLWRVEKENQLSKNSFVTKVLVSLWNGDECEWVYDGNGINVRRKAYMLTLWSISWSIHQKI